MKLIIFYEKKSMKIKRKLDIIKWINTIILINCKDNH